MKLTIFGATGRTGKPLVQQALAAGHEVTAFVRDPAKLGLAHERLHVVQGDVRDSAAVERAIVGADVVLSALGQTKTSTKDMQTTATRNIVAAMKHHGIRRLVSLTGAGVAAPEDQPRLMNHVISFALRMLDGDVLKDAENHAEVIRSSDLDWVIVRGPRLTEGPHTGKYRVGWVGVNTGVSISRADVADFMLKQVQDNTYLRKAPMISD
ncbi:MAG: SDR family oxidoreductase [Chloroflexaceae bacterium]|jgi:putative NADH-flavin reductase|nr:SDR family oxidoreductase [Chloroflexaceae bacterium]